MSESVAEILKNRGNQRLQDGNYQSAENLYTEAIDLDPSNAKYYSNRCTARLRLGKFEEALDDANLIINKDSKWIKGYIQKGSVLIALNRLDEAIEVFEIGKEIDPTNDTILSLLNRAKNQKNGSPRSSSESSNSHEYDESLKEFFIGNSHNILQTVVNGARFINLLILLMVMFPIFKFERSPVMYRVFNLCYIIIAGAILYDSYGRPQFNRQYLNHLMKDSYFLSFIYLYIFTGKNPMPIALVPLVLNEIMGLCSYSYIIIKKLNPSIANKIYSLFNRYIPRLLQIQDWNTLDIQSQWSALSQFISLFISLFELMLVLPLTFNIFRSFGNVVYLFVYINYLINLAGINPSLRTSAFTIDYKLRSFLTHLPPVFNRTYNTVSNFISRMYNSRIHA